MEFKLWLEAIAQVKDIEEAIKKTLKFTVPGVWDFTDVDNFGEYGIRIDGTLVNQDTQEGYAFLINTYAVFDKPIKIYDSIKGSPDMSMMAYVSYAKLDGHIEQLDEKKDLKTPYDTAHWIKNVIDGVDDYFRG